MKKDEKADVAMVMQIWDNDGSRWEIAEDRDGLDLVMFRYIDANMADPKEHVEILMPREVAERLPGVLLHYLRATSDGNIAGKSPVKEEHHGGA